MQKNIDGEKLTLLTKVSPPLEVGESQTRVDFDVDDVNITIGVEFFIRCRNSDNSIPASVNYGIRDVNDTALGQGTINLDANGEGSFTIPNPNTTVFRLQNITAGFIASIISDENTIGKKVSDNTTNIANEITNRQNEDAVIVQSVTDTNTRIDATNIEISEIESILNDGTTPLLTKVAPVNNIDFDVDDILITQGIEFFIQCRNSDNSIPASVNFQERDVNGALIQGTINLDNNGQGSYTIVNPNTTIFRLVNITAGFTASILTESDGLTTKVKNNTNQLRQDTIVTEVN